MIRTTSVKATQNGSFAAMEGRDTGSAPLISIVTATFNSLPALRRTVESVATQTFRDVEHVIVDGASRDGTLTYLEGLGCRVRWISEPDSGIADALNKGVAMTRGTYVLVLQADDVFAGPDSLAEAVPYLDDGPDIVSFDVLFQTAQGDRRIRSRGLTFWTNFKTTIPHQGAFCRRVLFDRIGLFNSSFQIGMDYDFFLRAHRAGTIVQRVPEILAHMPASGVSSEREWPSLARRFAEERRAHLAHCPGPAMRAAYALYWPAYLSYRRLRAVCAPAASGV